MEEWKRWIEISNLEKYTPNRLNDKQTPYIIDNKRDFYNRKAKKQAHYLFVLIDVEYHVICISKISNNYGTKQIPVDLNNKELDGLRKKFS